MNVYEVVRLATDGEAGSVKIDAGYNVIMIGCLFSSTEDAQSFLRVLDELNAKSNQSITLNETTLRWGCYLIIERPVL